MGTLAGCESDLIAPGSAAFEACLRGEGVLPPELGSDYVVRALSDDACLAVGSLLSARTRIPLLGDGHPPQIPGASEEEVRRRYIGNVRSSVLLQELPDAGVPSHGECLAAVLGQTNTVSGGGRVVVKPYEKQLHNAVT